MEEYAVGYGDAFEHNTFLVWKHHQCKPRRHAKSRKNMQRPRVVSDVVLKWKICDLAALTFFLFFFFFPFWDTKPLPGQNVTKAACLCMAAWRICDQLNCTVL